MSSPIHARYVAERTIRSGRSKLAGWSPKDIAALVARQPVRPREWKSPPAAAANSSTPTPDEMRRVATYMATVMGLHSCAGKLLSRAAQLER
jgi:hypothetical protein